MRAKRSELGFTLVELLVALAVTSAVLGVLSTVLFQFFSVTTHGHDRLAVLHDHDTAFEWINRDAQMAVPELATVVPSGVTLQWADAVGDHTYQSSYTQSGTELVRALTVDGTPSSQTVARNLAASGFSASKSGNLLTVSITSAKGAVTQTRAESVYMRPFGVMSTPFPTQPPTATRTPTPTNTPTPTPTSTPTPTPTNTPTPTPTNTRTPTPTNTPTPTSTNTPTPANTPTATPTNTPTPSNTPTPTNTPVTPTNTPTPTPSNTPTPTNTPVTPTNTPTRTPTYTPTPTSTSTPMRVATGSFTGNGADNRAITGVGFQPDLVFVKISTATSGVVRTSTMAGDASKPLTLVGALQPNMVQSLDANGFTVGNDARVNAAASTYYWVAMTAGDELKLGTYVGDGTDNRSITGVGFQPVWVMTLGDGSDSMFRPATIAGDASFLMDGTGQLADNIQALQPDGFQIGANVNVNKVGKTFHYVAWNTSANVRQTTYAGNGTDNRSIMGVGFQPLLVWVKRADMNQSTWRSASTVGDLSHHWGGTASAADRIQALESDGFQVGTSPLVNSSTGTYHYIAFKDGGPPPTATPTNTPTPTATFTRTPTPTPTSTSTPTPMWLTTGSYVGNGVDGRQITGVGFQPDVVIVKSAVGRAGVIRTSTMAGDAAKILGTTTALQSNRIQSFVADGFTTGTDVQVNASGETYYWVAMRAGSNTVSATMSPNTDSSEIIIAAFKWAP